MSEASRITKRVDVLPELPERDRQLQVVAQKAQDTFTPLGLTITGLRHYEPRRFQMEKNGVLLCLEAKTHNPHFYGEHYDNGVRTDLQGKVFGSIEQDIRRVFPEAKHVCLDIAPRLVPPFEIKESYDSVDPNVWKHRLVDVFQNDEDIFLDDVEKLRREGNIEDGSDFDIYTKKYGLTHVMRHGPFIYISPDTLPVEILEALLDQRNIRSVLEIGGGVGTCGKAARRRGITDYTFVEVNPKAAAHLRATLSDYTVVEQSGFDFEFDRDYDLVLLGMPYELNPWFIQKKGRGLAQHSDTVIFQSGMTCMYDQEHDWILGKNQHHRNNFPWWHQSQELGTYFPNVVETSFDWQLGVIASHRNLETPLALMEPRGFSKPKYNYVPFEE
ncbi:hypothetical protein COU77_01695 [Candidatus Peregrinibacteria bacterium CG10_big_fil_rev_8_21_14_0_10_49_16]|nr:MAG: hypothetical protein COU77_01695 [Candidatus Peregrinibacteria bacterium CG10_big_fil_rev_8_21_14_0_10_49_16]